MYLNMSQVCLKEVFPIPLVFVLSEIVRNQLLRNIVATFPINQIDHDERVSRN